MFSWGHIEHCLVPLPPPPPSFCIDHYRSGKYKPNHREYGWVQFRLCYYFFASSFAFSWCRHFPGIASSFIVSSPRPIFWPKYKNLPSHRRNGEHRAAKAHQKKGKQKRHPMDHGMKINIWIPGYLRGEAIFCFEYVPLRTYWAKFRAVCVRMCVWVFLNIVFVWWSQILKTKFRKNWGKTKAPKFQSRNVKRKMKTPQKTVVWYVWSSCFAPRAPCESPRNQHWKWFSQKKTIFDPGFWRIHKGRGGKTGRPDAATDHFLGGFHFPFDISALKFRCFNFPRFFPNLVLGIWPHQTKTIFRETRAHTHIYLPEPVSICPERSTFKTKIASSCINSEIEILIFIQCPSDPFFILFFCAPLRSCAHHFFDPEVIFLYFSQEIGEGDAIIKEETIPEKWGHHEKAEDDAKKKNTKGIKWRRISDDYISIYPTPSGLCKARGWRGEGCKAMLSVAKSVHPMIFVSPLLPIHSFFGGEFCGLLCTQIGHIAGQNMR